MTHNSFFKEKVALRLDCAEAVPKKKISVLEAYAGDPLCWKKVAKLTDKKLYLTGINHDSALGTFHLHGDSINLFRSLDLSKFDILDIDAFGFPYEHFIHVLRSSYKGYVIGTFIISHPGAFFSSRGLQDFMDIPKLEGVKFHYHDHSKALFNEFMNRLGVTEYRFFRPRKSTNYFQLYLWCKAG